MVLIIILCFFPVLASAQKSMPPGPPLFSRAQSSFDFSKIQAANPAIQRSRVARIDFDLLSLKKGPGRGPEMAHSVLLNLFDDTSVPVTFDRVEDNPSGSQTWIGKVDGKNNSAVTLVRHDGIVVGNVSGPQGDFQIRTLPDGAQAIHQVDFSKFPAEVPPLSPTGEGDTIQQGSTSTQNNIAMDTGGPILDILVGYTPLARDAQGGEAGILALIDLAVAETNQSYINSNVDQRLNLVHAVEVNYDETGKSFSNHLNSLRGTSDGVMDEIHALRDTHGADLVGLIVDDDASCGIGYLMTYVSSSFQSNAFTVTHYSCATGYYSFGHEIGHNMGARHDRHVDNTDNSPYTYNHGHVNVTDRWRTIMSYNTACTSGYCTRIQYWSNPGVYYNSDAMGTPDGLPDAVDNHLTLNNTAPTVAQFRQSGHTLMITGGPAGEPNPVEPSGSVHLSVEATDSSGHGLTYNWTASCGSLGTGSFNDPIAAFPIWTAPNNSGAPAVCTLTVTVRDDINELSDTASFPLTLNSSNSGPSAENDSATVNEEGSVVIAVLSNDTGAEGNGLDITSVTQPASGSVTINDNGAGDSSDTVTYTAPTNFNGSTLFTYEVSDAFNNTDTGTVTVIVGSVNDNPVTVSDSYTTSKNTPLLVNAPGILQNDSDPDGDSLTASLGTPPTKGTVSLGVDGGFTFTPTNNVTGKDQFTYRASDGNGEGTVGTVSIFIKKSGGGGSTDGGSGGGGGKGGGKRSK